LSTQLDGELAKMKRALDGSLPKINSVLKTAGQPEIVPRAVEVAAPKTDIVMDDDDTDGP
ncbi:MAG TPA: hypothetical protein VFI52_03990, partial [Gemmatimonadaceae bacterium]|nr:hypothetical protein [Gemmatimonadaceae bacterium]